MSQSMTPASQQQQTTTIAQKTKMVAAVALFLAMPVIVLIRKKTGYRFLNPTNIFAMVMLLFIYGSLSIIVTGINPTATYADAMAGYTSSYAIIGFALVVLIAAVIQRSIRWNDIKRGVAWHTYSRGVSRFAFLPFSDSQTKRFVDPAVCAFIGLICMSPLRFLGYYLLFAAACLFIFEAWDYEVQLNTMLDTLDSLVDSEVMSQNVEYYSQPHPKERPITETAGIPTGIAADIQHQIERRRVRRALPADNLVVATTTTDSLPGAAL